MPRKVSHDTRIVPINAGGRKFIPGDIIQFNYRGGSDRRPTVFVLKKDTKSIRGVNINYLTEYEVGRLLEETNYQKMKYYSLYEDAFRSYSLNKMTMTKIVGYEIDED